MGTTSKHSWSRRDFLKGAAAGTMSVAALGALGGCFLFCDALFDGVS